MSIPEIDRLHLEPRCHVCRNDEVRKKVNDLLASGASYAMTLRALGDDSAVGVTSDSIRRHAEERGSDFRVGQAVAREPGDLRCGRFPRTGRRTEDILALKSSSLFGGSSRPGGLEDEVGDLLRSGDDG